MKLYMFRTVLLSIIRSFSLYTQQWHMSYRFAGSLQAGSGWNCSEMRHGLFPLHSDIRSISLLLLIFNYGSFKDAASIAEVITVV
jgi:hypothetical protein